LRRRTVLAACLTLAIPSWMVLEGCTDGTTPDCAAPDAGCAPSEDGATVQPDSTAPFDGGNRPDGDDRSAPDGARDAQLDGDARG
jgi:hypothetical protein